MEYITVDYIMQVKERAMPFLYFILIPCAWWWITMIWNIIRFLVYFFDGISETLEEDKQLKEKPPSEYD